MDKKTSFQKVSAILENPFDRERFVTFINELLGRMEHDSRSYSGNLIPKPYRDYVSFMERVAKYSDGRNNVDILVVQLKRESSIERARTMQRNFIAWYLNGSRGGELKDAALVAFVSPENNDWRFSLVKMDYKIEESSTGRVKVREDFTPARRWSFLVGANEKSHTAQSRLAPILQDDAHSPTLEELEEAFNIEKVTDEFFEKYRDLFLRTKDALDEIVKSSKNVRKDFEDKGVNTTDFSKKLLGQIVFLYFLQKKGWFGVERDADWGTGPKDFLRRLFTGAHGKYKNFFNDILEPLFYEALARQRDDDFYSKFDCKIPFLNGGLFDALNGYDWIHTDILLPNELFSNTHQTSEGDIGDGTFDVFDRYNFTVREDQPLEREVAVDPEMLGKIFENLLEVKDRKSKGTYYTPREIVNYMCEQGLVNYLDTSTKGVVSKEDLLNLIKNGERLASREKIVDSTGEETRTYHHDPSFQNVKKHAPELDEALRDIKVCDPAIGSGAFPVGMMTLIVKTREVLSDYVHSQERTPYELKRHCIQNSIYGVDIDPGAVEIAKLRLWLSLVVDEEDIKKIKPLPNLDYKIMQGNSLLEEYEGIRLFDEDVITEEGEFAEERSRQLTERRKQLQSELNALHRENKLTKTKRLLIEKEFGEIKKKLDSLSGKSGRVKEGDSLFYEHNRAKEIADKLQRLYRDFMESYTKEKKEELRGEIGELEWALIEATLKEHEQTSALHEIEKFKKAKVRPYFLWKLHFPEVFRNGGRFDVVIANPPWVRDEKIKDQKPGLSRSYETYTGGADLYVYFYERAVKLLKPGGTISFISSNKFFRAAYGKKLRAFLAENTSISNLIDFGDLPVFDATTYPSVLIAKRMNGAQAGHEVKAFTLRSHEELKHFEQVFDENAMTLPQFSLSSEGWLIEDGRVLAILEKMKKAGLSLDVYAEEKIYRGIITGFNEAFVINDETRRKLIKEDKKSAEVIKPFLRGRDIKRYAIQGNGLSLIYIPYKWTDENRGKKGPEAFFKEKYPAIHRHLRQFEEELKARDDQGDYWWELRPCSYLNEFAKTKIIYPNILKAPEFALDGSGYYTNQKCFIIPRRDLFLLGVLNSSVTFFLFRQLLPKLRGDFYEPSYVHFKAFPIATAAAEPHREIEDRVKKILAAKKRDPEADTTELEREIDKIVCKLYGLTEEEIKIVEGRSTS